MADAAASTQAMVRARAREREGKDLRSVREKAAQLRRAKAGSEPRAKRPKVVGEEIEEQTLPADFFDAKAEASAAPVAAVPAAEVAEAPAVSQELPAGFFDDRDADMRARGLNAKKGAAAADDWADFQQLARNVARDEDLRLEDEAKEADDDVERRRLEQAWYERYRLAPLLARADKADLADDRAVNDDEDNRPDDTVDITALLRRRQRQRQTPAPTTSEVADEADDAGEADEDDEDDFDAPDLAAKAWRSRGVY